MISQLYPGNQDDDHERALDRAIDGRQAEVLTKRRRYVDASPLASWADALEFDAILKWLSRELKKSIAAGKLTIDQVRGLSDLVAANCSEIGVPVVVHDVTVVHDAMVVAEPCRRDRDLALHLKGIRK